MLYAVCCVSLRRRKEIFVGFKSSSGKRVETKIYMSHVCKHPIFSGTRKKTMEIYIKLWKGTVGLLYKYCEYNPGATACLFHACLFVGVFISSFWEACQRSKGQRHVVFALVWAVFLATDG